MMMFNISTFDGTKALLAASEIPTEMILESFYKSILQDSVQLQTALALYEQENTGNNEQPSCSGLKTSVRRRIDQTMRTRNFRARDEIVERGAVLFATKRLHNITLFFFELISTLHT